MIKGKGKVTNMIFFVNCNHKHNNDIWRCSWFVFEHYILESSNNNNNNNNNGQIQNSIISITV